MGEEEFTRGRPHPMIDGSLRIQRLYQESRDPEVAVIQMDVVLGYSADPDPSHDLAPAIREILQSRDDLIVLIAITGTEDDPQVRSKQVEAFEACGAVVMDSNAEASQLAGTIAQEIQR